MSNIMLELGQLSQAKLPVTEFESMLKAKCEQLKRVKLYLAIRAARRIPMGGKHLGGLWVKPAPKS